MIRNKLAAAIAAIGALQAGVVGALGMGDLTLNSALNQPLDAEIRLNNTKDLDRTQVLIKMASPTDFDNAGVSLDYSLTTVKFNVILDGDGGGIIKVTTREPIIEPYLNFLVETRWPTGRMLREYTVLLDLPLFSESAARPIEQAASGGSAAAQSTGVAPRQSSKAPASVAANVRNDSPRSAPLSSEGEYRVRNNDTLWQIANNNRPGSASVQQTMVGIQKLNPRAFVKGNINRLKSGSVLRLPSLADISVSANQAVSEVASQNRAWRQGDETVIEATGAQLDATDSYEASEIMMSSEPRLSIAAGGSDDRSSAGDGSGLTSGSKALQDDLVAAQESLDKTARENDELQSRLDDMESKVATLQRLLELKDDQLAVMQGNFSEGEQRLNADNVPAKIAGSSENEIMKVVDTSDATAAQVAKEQAQQARKTIVTKPKELSLLDQLLANPLYAGGVGALLLGLLLLVIKRRRNTDDEESERDQLSNRESDAIDTSSDLAEGEASATDIDRPEEEDTAADLIAELEQELTADSNIDDPTVALVEETQDIELETGDPIAEADIYIAYGRFQQAIDLLRSSIDKEPSRSDLHVKLLEVFIETRDKASFGLEFGRLQLLGDRRAFVQVTEMIAGVDDVSAWLDDVEVPDFSDAEIGADFIEEDESNVEQAQIGLTTEAEQAISPESEDDLDFSAVFDASSLDGAQENAMVTMESLESSDSASDRIQDDLAADLALGKLEASQSFELDLDDDLNIAALDASDLSDLEAEFGDGEESTGDFPGDEFSLQLESEPADIDSSSAIDVAELELETEFNPDDLDAGFEIDAGVGDASALELDAFALEIDVSTEEDDFELDLGEFELDEEASAEMTGEALVAAGVAAAASPLVSDDSVNSQVDIADEEAGDEDFDFLADTDEVATKLDLARAYIDMGDSEGARDILDEVQQEGSEEQQREAATLIDRIE